MEEEKEVKTILKELKEDSDRKFSLLFDKFDGLEGRFDGLEKHVDDLASETKQHIDEKAEETKRHFEVVAERLEDKIQILAEQVAANTEKLLEHDNHFNNIEDTLGVMKLDIGFIKRDLNKKANQDELAAIEKRLSKLEIKFNRST